MLKKIAFSVLGVMLLTSCSEPIQLSPDAKLPDGGVYQGDIKNGLFEGQGSLKYSNGTYYEGQFKSGNYHGQGKLVYSNGRSYEGEFFQGSLTGQFVMLAPKNKVRYEGELLDGYMHGQGKLTYASGITYEGEFQDSLYHGKGVYQDASGSTYEGEFKDGSYDGQGKIIYANGSIYEGQFSDGSYSGQGRYSIEDVWYEGVFVDGELTGQGEYLDSQGNHYQGEISTWAANGEGKLVEAGGAILKGMFESGYLDGLGEKINPDGSLYKGNFQYNKYDGIGSLTKADGSVYEGEFSYGYFHGQGELITIDSDTGEEQVLTGRWNQGQLVFNAATGEREHLEAELALENHQKNLAASLSKIIEGDSHTNVYFLGVAGDGSQSVFRRELEFVADEVEKKYSTQNRSVLLINHHTTAAKYPMATRRSITSAVMSIGEKMDNDDDILFMYLSSHGSKDHDFYLNHDSISLPDISPKELKKILFEAKVKWKVLIVSACYSGGFISDLQDEHTLIMTASDSQSTSFGCSEESEMTYFGKALFKNVLSENDEIKLDEAFIQAKEIILGWETDEELEPSNPMISASPAIMEKLATLNN